MEKIFGTHDNFRNLLIQIAQKVIWFTRIRLEKRKKIDDPTEKFKKYLIFTLTNLRKIVNDEIFRKVFVSTGIVKISRYKLIFLLPPVNIGR